MIVITIDTLRADHLPAWGYQGQVVTPAIDRLVDGGVRFANAYAQVPLTLPSHATLFTGLLPYEHGVRSNIGYQLDATRHETLAAMLRAEGYATGAAVSAYVLRSETGIASGFDFFDDSLELDETATLGLVQRNGEQSLQAATSWMDGVVKGPFLLWLHLFEPHTPYDPPEPFRSASPLPYDGEIGAADALVGRVLEALDRHGLYDTSLVILTSDHGEGLGDHGEDEHGILLYREALHVPLILKLPQQRRSGEVVAAPVALFDLVPTVLDELGLEIPAALSGASLLAELPADRRIYSETLDPRLHLGWSELRSLVDASLHFIEGPDAELYDIVRDPGERRNLRDELPVPFQERREALAALPLSLTAPGVASDEERARLAALGYLTGPAPGATDAASESDRPRRDPKASLGLLEGVKRAHEEVGQGRLLPALSRLEPLVRDNPDMIDARVQIAAIQRHLGRPRRAREEYVEVVRRAPDYAKIVAIEIGKIDLDLGDLDTAEDNARLALDVSPDEAHLLLAAIAVQRGDLATAEREARLAGGDPQRPRMASLVMLARILGARGDHAGGVVVLEEARRRLASGGGAPTATLDSTLGDLLAHLGRHQDAEAAFRREIANFPHTEEAYVRLAILLAAQRRFEEIQPTLDAMVAVRPSPSAYALAARTMTDLGNTDGAAEYLRRARELAERPE